MIAKNRLFLLLSLLWTIAAQAQMRKLVAIDVDAVVPVVGASVLTNGGSTITDSAGCFTVPDTCQLMMISHMNYESRVVHLNEVRDTVLLISKELNLREVVVFGLGPEDAKTRELNRRLRLKKQDAEMLNANPNSGLNLGGVIKAIIPRKWMRRAKEERRKRLQQVLEDY